MTVTLIDSMGDDLRIVNAARVSHNKRSAMIYVCPTCNGRNTSDRTNGLMGCGDCHIQFERHRADTALKPADAGLIGYLMKNRHGTPFEMVQFTFHVECPIGVAREWQRHRIGSFNEVSTRYVEMEPHCFIPHGAAIRTQVGKPGHYEMVPMSEPEGAIIEEEMQRAYMHAHSYYQTLIKRGLAKEVARNVLPLGQYTQFYWSVNLRSLFNFVSLRTAQDALLEIRTEAKEVERLATAVVPEAFNAFVLNSRVAP